MVSVHTISQVTSNTNLVGGKCCSQCRIRLIVLAVLTYKPKLRFESIPRLCIIYLIIKFVLFLLHHQLIDVTIQPPWKTWLHPVCLHSLLPRHSPVDAISPRSAIPARRAEHWSCNPTVATDGFYSCFRCVYVCVCVRRWCWIEASFTGTIHIDVSLPNYGLIEYKSMNVNNHRIPHTVSSRKPTVKVPLHRISVHCSLSLDVIAASGGSVILTNILFCHAEQYRDYNATKVWLFVSQERHHRERVLIRCINTLCVWTLITSKLSECYRKKGSLTIYHTVV